METHVIALGISVRERVALNASGPKRRETYVVILSAWGDFKSGHSYS